MKGGRGEEKEGCRSGKCIEVSSTDEVSTERRGACWGQCRWDGYIYMRKMRGEDKNSGEQGRMQSGEGFKWTCVQRCKVCRGEGAEWDGVRLRKMQRQRSKYGFRLGDAKERGTYEKGAEI